jgi:hypothetical protein
MRRILIGVFVLVVLILAYFIFTYKPSNEQVAKDFLKLHKNHYEQIFKLTEEKGYVSIQWRDEEKIVSPSTVKLAWMRGTPKHVKVDNPDLENIIKYSRDKGLTQIWIRKFEDNWIVMKAFRYQEGGDYMDGIFVFGNPNNDKFCSPQLSASKCYIEVSDNWFMVK